MEQLTGRWLKTEKLVELQAAGATIRKPRTERCSKGAVLKDLDERCARIL